MPTTYLVTGANRGLGLELARQLTGRGDQVIATARNPKEAGELSRLVRDIIPLDVTDAASIDGLPVRLGERPIDVLINNAGASSESKSVEGLTASELQRVFMVNSTGPLLVVRAVLKNLKAGKRKTIVNVSSVLGSIGSNIGGSYGYRASKAALNMLTATLANELRPQGFTCIVLHPGWVQTDMGGPNAPLKPAQSISSLLKVVDGLKPADSGKYFSYDGQILPW
jgi:NAD(P)-dependent dehydrogenase (short-subunit alcohol dehydrogenase family)